MNKCTKSPTGLHTVAEWGKIRNDKGLRQLKCAECGAVLKTSRW